MEDGRHLLVWEVRSGAAVALGFRSDHEERSPSWKRLQQGRPMGVLVFSDWIMERYDERY